MGISMRLLFVLSCELHQVGLDEVVDVSVHHGSDIGGLIACAMVLVIELLYFLRRG